MNKLCILVLVAACGAKTATTPANQAPTPATDQGSATEEPMGAVCGTRGAAECPAGQVCSYQPGASCGEADGPGRGMVRPATWAPVCKPVCGCDGKTYGNSCAAAAAAVGVGEEGDCKSSMFELTRSVYCLPDVVTSHARAIPWSAGAP